MDDKTQEPLPCPFCGSAKLIHHEQPRRVYEGMGAAWIRCDSCHCTLTAPEYEKLIVMWNTRASIAPKVEGSSTSVVDWLCKCGILHATGSYCGTCETSAPGILTPTYPLIATRENNALRAEVASLKDVQNYINKCLRTKDEGKEKLGREIAQLQASLQTCQEEVEVMREALKAAAGHFRFWAKAKENDGMISSAEALIGHAQNCEIWSERL
jgi:hypothetical protein